MDLPALKVVRVCKNLVFPITEYDFLSLSTESVFKNLIFQITED